MATSLNLPALTGDQPGAGAFPITSNLIRGDGAGGSADSGISVASLVTGAAGSSNQIQYNSGGAFAASANFTYDPATKSVAVNSNSATALVIGPNGATNPAFVVDGSTASAATGLKVTAAAAGSGVSLIALSSAANEDIIYTPKGTGSNVFTNEISQYNAGYATANYERNRQYWAGSIFNISNEFGGSAAARTLRIGIAGSAGVSTLSRWLQIQNSTPFFQVNVQTGNTGNFWDFSGSSSAASTGVVNFLSINPTINQTGSAGYTALVVNPTESTVGSGTKSLMDLQIGGVSKFRVTNSGGTILTVGSTLAFSVGPNGVTNPAFTVDTSVGSAATGLQVQGNAAGSQVNLNVLSSGTNEGMRFVAKGTGRMVIPLATAGMRFYQTTDETTNTAYFDIGVSGGRLQFNTAATGSGSAFIGHTFAVNGAAHVAISPFGPYLEGGGIGYNNSAADGVPKFRFGFNLTNTANNATLPEQSIVAADYCIQQTSGTGGSIGFRISAQQLALGSGTHRLLTVGINSAPTTPTAVTTATYQPMFEVYNNGMVFHNGGQRHKKVNVADAAYNVLITDYVVAYTSLTAARAVTLLAPASTAGTVLNPQYFIIKDQTGNAATFNITCTPASGTIDGAANKVISAAYGILRVYCDGTNYYQW